MRTAMVHSAAAMMSAKRFCASSAVIVGVVKNSDEQIVDLGVRVRGHQLVGARMTLPLARMSRPFFMQSLAAARSTSPRTGSEPFFRLKAT